MITKELLKEWNACRSGYDGFNRLFPNGAELDVAMEGLIEDGHDDWSFWLFDACRERGLYPEIVINGYRNSGDRNSGDWNSGDRNSGDRNSGDWNSGDRNSGDRNSGDRNSGDWNSGDWNSGDWNSGDWNSGFFNTKTPDIILIFDKPCDRKEWENAYKPNFLYFDITKWVDESNMTDQEKVDDPHFHVRGGQLQTKPYKEAFVESWEKADKEDREKVKDLPNFDAELFYEISGIKV